MRLGDLIIKSIIETNAIESAVSHDSGFIFVWRANAAEQIEASLYFNGCELASPSEVPCCRCRGPVVEFSIPNECWNMIIRQQGPETDQEYLCLSCFSKKASDFVDSLKSENETLERENAAMREAIKEAHASIEHLIDIASGGMRPANGPMIAIRNGHKTLTKIQPFLKP